MIWVKRLFSSSSLQQRHILGVRGSLFHIDLRVSLRIIWHQRFYIFIGGLLTCTLLWCISFSYTLLERVYALRTYIQWRIHTANTLRCIYLVRTQASGRVRLSEWVDGAMLGEASAYKSPNRSKK
jgi:hypothetical protein